MKEDQNPELISGLWLIQLLFKHIKFFIVIFILFAVGSVTYSLLLPNKYTATAKILPKSENTSDFGNLASLASMAGIAIGSQSYEALFLEIVVSDYILGRIIQKKT